MVGGELFRGTCGFIGEIRHMTIDPEGNLCGDGKRGCWETYVSLQAVLRHVRELLPEASSGKLRDRSREGSISLTFDEVVLPGSAGDPAALRVMQEEGENLAIGIGNLINIFDPELEVLGRAPNLASMFLIPIIESELKPFVLEPPAQFVLIVSSAHGADTCLMGGIAYMLDDFFSASFLQK